MRVVTGGALFLVATPLPVQSPATVAVSVSISALAVGSAVVAVTVGGAASLVWRLIGGGIGSTSCWVVCGKGAESWCSSDCW